MGQETFICDFCGHELPWNYQHEEKPGTCFLDYTSEADQTRITQAMREIAPEPKEAKAYLLFGNRLTDTQKVALQKEWGALWTGSDGQALPVHNWIVERLQIIVNRMKNGCRNHGCIIKAPTGMATNGACRCGARSVARELQDIAAALLRRRGDTR